MTRAISLGLAAGIFAGDQWLKNRAEECLREGETLSWCGGRLLIRKLHNSGMMLNLGESRRKLVALLSVILTGAAAAIFLVSFGQKGCGLLRLGLGTLLGGAFSNTYDRLKRKYVVDYFSFGVKWKNLRRVVFNLADLCVMIGAVLTVLGSQTCQ